MAELGLLIKIGLDKDSLKKANKQIGDFLKTGLKGAAIGAGAALATVGVAAAAAAAETLAFADEANGAMEKFRRETGLAEESVEEFSGSAKNLFAAGVGEGIDDIAQAMATVNNTMQTGAKETEGLTKRALVMRDVFDKDVGESVDTVKVLMDEMGLTGEQSFDFITTGIQKGLDRNGDFLDSIREYGNLFGDAGFDASQFFSILESGAGGGVLGTDKIGDAVKELGIRLTEGGKDAKQAFSDVVGVSFDDAATLISTGEAQWADYFGDIISGLQDIEDPLERNRQQVALFGTQAEDLGVGFSENIDMASTSLDDMTGSMDAIVSKNMTLGESMATLNRQMIVALEPAAQELMPLLAEGVSKVSEFLTEARPIFQGFASELAEKLGPAAQIVGESLQRIGVVLGIVSEDADGMDASLEALEKTLNLIVTAIEAVAVAAKLMADAFEIAKGLADQVGTISGLAAKKIGGDEEQGLFGKEGALNIFGIGTDKPSILGFAGGGGFTVGGSGAPDSQLVQFMGTPGEKVEVTPPGQGGGLNLTINIQGPVFGVDDLVAKLNIWGQQIIDATAGAMN
ncbi:MAG: hypothetical protein KAJ19_25080 [Gammaproteobacteria bacterium]|nr:hypothetical protein [Gammaproteobacteria bacterium]